MAKFCVVCGSALENNKCPKGCTSEALSEAAANTGKSNVIAGLAAKIKKTALYSITLYRGMFVHPVENMAAAIKLNTLPQAVVFLIIQAILTGILFATGLRDFYTAYIGFDDSALVIFGKAAAFELVLLFGVIAGIYVVGGLFLHGNRSFINSIKVVGISQVCMTAFTTVALILAFLKTALGLAVLLYGLLMVTILYYQGARNYLEISDNRLAYLIPSACTIALLICYFYLSMFSF